MTSKSIDMCKTSIHEEVDGEVGESSLKKKVYESLLVKERLRGWEELFIPRALNQTHSNILQMTYR